MATDDEVRRLILEVVGEEKVRTLREQIDQEKESLVSLTNTLSHLTPAQIAQDKGVQLATIHLAEMNAELHKLERANIDAGRAAYVFSQGLEDLQYGVGGIINNIPQLVMALGGTAGLTAAISIAAVGINQLVKHFLPEWEGGVKKVKKAHEELTQEMKDQKEAIEALNKAKATDEGIKGIIGKHGEEMRKALGEQMVGEEQSEAQRLFAEETRLRREGTPEALALIPGVRQRFERTITRQQTAQDRANMIVGRAALGGLPEQARLRGLFGPDTAIGADLAEASPERAEQRRLDEQQVEQQKRMHRLDEQLARQKEQAAQKNAQAMGQAFQDEEQDLHRQQQAGQHAAHEKRQAEQREVQAKHKAAAAAEHKARNAEREFIEDIRLRADQALAGGAPAGLVGAQANALFARMAQTNGQTTNLAQAQARMMLMLQKEQERQERQNQETERKVQQFWDNAFRRGK